MKVLHVFAVVIFTVVSCIAQTTPEQNPEGKRSDSEMILLTGGTFQMGNDKGYSDESPVHSVKIKDFYIGKYEVTQREYQDMMGSNPSYFRGDSLPIEQVSWFDAIAYCNARSVREGLQPVYTIEQKLIPTKQNGNDSSVTYFAMNIDANGYRLPTEAEWEYAARGGEMNSGKKFSGSDSLAEAGWYNENSDYKTHRIGEKIPNEAGLYDMCGNVWEWCWDWYDESIYKSEVTESPTGADSGTRRVNRGGAWCRSIGFCRSTLRYSLEPMYRNGDLGFRVVRNAE